MCSKPSKFILLPWNQKRLGQYCSKTFNSNEFFLENLKLKKGLHILHVTAENGISKRQLIVIE